MRVAAPPRATFDYLAEPRNRPQWQSSLRAVEVLTDGPTRVGTRWVDRTTVGASPTLEITAMTPPATSPPAAGTWTEVGIWAGFTASLTLEFRPVETDPGATEVGVTLEITGEGVWGLGARVMRMMAGPAVRTDLRQAAGVIEAAQG